MQHRIQPEHRPLHHLILLVLAQPIHVWALEICRDFDGHAQVAALPSPGGRPEAWHGVIRLGVLDA